MKKNILAENMIRFGTKNLSEANLEDLENKLGFDSGANRDPRTGNLNSKPKGSYAFSIEGFLEAIADKINELNGNATTYTSAELDSVLERADDEDDRYKFNQSYQEWEMSLASNGTVLREIDFNTAVAIALGRIFSELVKDQNKLQTYLNDTI